MIGSILNSAGVSVPQGLGLRDDRIVDIAVAIAVTKVEYHPNGKPDTSPDPGFLRQKRHHKQAGKPGKQR